MLNMLLPIPGQMSSTLTVFLLFNLVILFQVFPKPDPTISSCISYLQGPVTVTAIHRRPVGQSHFCPFLFLPVTRTNTLSYLCFLSALASGCRRVERWWWPSA
jgi:hypothetical protein